MLCTLNILKMVLVGIRTFVSCLVNFFFSENNCVFCAIKKKKINIWWSVATTSWIFKLLPQQEVTFNGTFPKGYFGISNLQTLWNMYRIKRRGGSLEYFVHFSLSGKFPSATKSAVSNAMHRWDVLFTDRSNKHYSNQRESQYVQSVASSLQSLFNGVNQEF